MREATWQQQLSPSKLTRIQPASSPHPLPKSNTSSNSCWDCAYGNSQPVLPGLSGTSWTRSALGPKREAGRRKSWSRCCMASEARTIIDTGVAVSAVLLPRSVPRKAFDLAAETLRHVDGGQRHGLGPQRLRGSPPPGPSPPAGCMAASRVCSHAFRVRAARGQEPCRQPGKHGTRPQRCHRAGQCHKRTMLAHSPT